MYGILIFEWVQTGLVTGVAFEVFVYNYGDDESLTKIYYGWFLVDIMCSVVSVTVRLFFAWRIFVLALSALGRRCNHIGKSPTSSMLPVVLISALGLVALVAPSIYWNNTGRIGGIQKTQTAFHTS